jgi:hypothetical protein
MIPLHVIFVGGRIIMQQKKLDSRTQLDEFIECALGGGPFFLLKNSAFTFFLLVRILCALRLESRKQMSKGLDARLLEFQFLRPRGCFNNPFITLSLCFGVTGKTPGLISRNTFVKKILSASTIVVMS